MSVRQKMAPPRLTELPSLASNKVASTKQAPLKLAPRKSAPQASASVKLVLLRLEPRTSNSMKVVELLKSQPEAFLPLPGMQLVPLG